MTAARRRALFALLYFAEGAPIGFIWWTLPTLLRKRGVPVEEITALTSVVILPWALKFARAPWIDRLSGERAPLRSWIFVAQLAMAATLVPLLFIDLAASPALITKILVVHAVAAATQDVCVDALCVRAVPPAERGSMNGWMQAGMLTGRALFGGGALVLAADVGHVPMVGAMVFVTVTTAIVALRLAPADSEPAEQREPLWPLIRTLLGNRRTWGGLLFALAGEATFKGVGSIVGPLLVDRGVSEASIGIFFGFGSVGAMVLGALLGGRLADRRGKLRVVAAGQLLVSLGVAAMALGAGAGALLWGGLCAFYLGVGAFTAAAYAALMDVTDPRLGGTQFSAYMGMTNLCESWSSRVVGRMYTRAGYGTALPVAVALGLAALPLLALLRPTSSRARRASSPG